MTTLSLSHSHTQDGEPLRTVATLCTKAASGGRGIWPICDAAKVFDLHNDLHSDKRNIGAQV